jgi:hypothetical protein
VILSIQIKRSNSILTARVDKVIYFFYYLNNAHTTEILKPDTISNDLKNSSLFNEFACNLGFFGMRGPV